MKTLEERNKIVEENLTLAKTLAKRKYFQSRRTVQYDDLESAAFRGLIDAAERFNADKLHKGYPFAVYARSRICGEMIDYLRDISWGSRSGYITPLSLEAKIRDQRSSSTEPTIRDLVEDKKRSVIDEANSEQLFDKVIKCLSSREKKIFKLRFIYNLTLLDIAERTKLTESRVSQIITTNIEYLKNNWYSRKDELLSELN